MYKKELPRVSPERVHIASARVQRLIEDLERVTEMHGVMIARGGSVIAEGWWSPYTPDMPHILHSLGKSYVGTGVGMAVTEGLLDTEERIVDLFAEDFRALGLTPTPLQEHLRVRHLLTMSGDDFRDDRFKVISQLFIPAPEIPPGGRFCSDFREYAVPLALENLSKCIADCLNFFVRPSL